MVPDSLAFVTLIFGIGGWVVIVGPSLET